MTAIARRQKLIAAVVFLLTLGTAGMAYTRPTAARLMMACSNASGALAPCTSSATVAVNSSGNSFIFTLTNNSGGYKEGNINCSVTSPVTSCTVNNPGYALNAHTSMTDTVIYGAGSTPGTGSVTVSTGGLIGSLSATLTATVVPPVSVTPDNQVVTATSLSSNSQAFTVANNTSGSLTFTLVTHCSGNATACSAQGSVSLGAGGSAPISVAYTAGATLTIGTISLIATSGSQTDSGWVRDSVPKTIAVTPDNQAVTTYPRASGQTFTITNTRSVTTSYNLSRSCTGAAVTNCVAPSAITLASGQSSPVLVSYFAGAGGTTGSITLTATAQGDAPNTDPGSVSITVNAIAPCTDTNATMYPCNVGRSAVVGSVGITDTVVVTSITGAEMDESCIPQGHVTSCTITPDVFTGNLPKTLTLTYAVTADTGAGSDGSPSFGPILSRQSGGFHLLQM